MLERRIGSRSIAEFRKAKLVYIRIGPPDLGPGTPQRSEEGLKKTRLHPVIGIQKIDAFECRKGGQGEVDAGVARRAEPAIALAKIINLVEINGCEIATDLVGLLKWTAVVDHDNGVCEIRLLSERRVKRL